MAGKREPGVIQRFLVDGVGHNGGGPAGLGEVDGHFDGGDDRRRVGRINAAGRNRRGEGPVDDGQRLVEHCPRLLHRIDRMDRHRQAEVGCQSAQAVRVIDSRERTHSR